MRNAPDESCRKAVSFSELSNSVAETRTPRRKNYANEHGHFSETHGIYFYSHPPVAVRSLPSVELCLGVSGRSVCRRRSFADACVPEQHHRHYYLVHLSHSRRSLHRRRGYVREGYEAGTNSLAARCYGDGGNSLGLAVSRSGSLDLCLSVSCER